MDITLDSLKEDNEDIEYKCVSYITSKGFTKLMKLVMMTKEYPELEKEIEEIINENPEEINKQNNYGFTALTLAAMNSNVNIVKLLLEHPNIDVNIRDVDGWTVLMRVCKYNTYSNIEIVKLLLKHPNIDVNIQDVDGWTALIVAVDNNIQSNIEIIKLLLEHPDINVNIKDVDGWNALMTASKYINVISNMETLLLLLNNIKVDVTDFFNFLMMTDKIHLFKLIPYYKIDKSIFGKYVYIYDLINEKITKETFGKNMQNNRYSDIEISFNL
jgi:ankyrin repeat protein